MTPAEVTTCAIIERTLGGDPAFRRVDEKVFLYKEGSSIVMIHVLPLGEDRAVVRCVAQLVKGITLVPELARHLLELNATLRFGAFSYIGDEGLLLFTYSILGGPSLDSEALLTTLREVAFVAEEYDERIAHRYGGRTMRELLGDRCITEQSLTINLDRDPDDFGFN